MQLKTSLWFMKVGVICCVALSAIAAGVGAGVFQTGCWAFLCYGIGSAGFLSSLMLVALSYCCCRAPVQLKKETPIPSSATSFVPKPVVTSQPASQPKNKSEVIAQEIALKQQSIEKLIQDLPIPDTSIDPANYSKEQLRKQVPRAEGVELSQQLDDYLKALESHFKGVGFSSSPYPVIGIPNVFKDNQYIQVGLLILTHTPFADFLFYRPELTSEQASDFKMKYFQQTAPKQSKQKPSAKQKYASLARPDVGVNRARLNLQMAVSDLRKGICPNKEALQSIKRKVEALIATDEKSGSGTRGRPMQILHLLFKDLCATLSLIE